MFKTFSAFLTLLFLSACQVPKVDLFSVRDYENEHPFSVKVSAIEIQDKTNHYSELPHIENRIPLAPITALSQAIHNRFKSNYPESAHSLTVVIHKASLTQELKESDKWYILDNMEYLLSYELDIVYTHNNTETEKQTISGWEKQALPKRSSIADKEQAWEKMLNAMVQKVTDKIYADMPYIYKR